MSEGSKMNAALKKGVKTALVKNLYLEWEAFGQPIYEAALRDIAEDTTATFTHFGEDDAELNLVVYVSDGMDNPDLTRRPLSELLIDLYDEGGDEGMALLTKSLDILRAHIGETDD